MGQARRCRLLTRLAAVVRELPVPVDVQAHRGGSRVEVAGTREAVASAHALPGVSVDEAEHPRAGTDTVADPEQVQVGHVERHTFKPIAVALGQIYISDYWHNDGPEGPTDVDDDPAAAILYAAECYMWGLPAFAGLVADRATAAADYWVQLAPGRGDADCDAAVVTEAQRQLATLDGLAPLARWLPQGAGWAAPERESLLLQLEALIAVPRLDSTSTPAANED